MIAWILGFLIESWVKFILLIMAIFVLVLVTIFLIPILIPTISLIAVVLVTVALLLAVLFPVVALIWFFKRNSKFSVISSDKKIKGQKKILLIDPAKFYLNLNVGSVQIMHGQSEENVMEYEVEASSSLNDPYNLTVGKVKVFLSKQVKEIKVNVNVGSIKVFSALEQSNNSIAIHAKTELGKIDSKIKSKVDGEYQYILKVDVGSIKIFN